MMEDQRMLNIKIAIPCKGSSEEVLLFNNPRFLEERKKLKDEGVACIDTIANVNNTYTLTQFGNKMIDESKNDYDYLILMHSDVDLSIYDFVKKLIETKDKYDVVGMAGTKKLFISQSPLTWFTGSNRFKEDRYGRITHDHDGFMVESFFNEKKKDVTDTEVLAIDGLLMCLDKKVLNDPKTRFDENFTYDFYDLDFCINVQLNTDYKIGVIVLPTIHKSVGKAVLDKEFLVPERKFRVKWNDRLK